MRYLTVLFTRWLAMLAGVALVAVMLLIVADIVLRLFGSPIPGSYELVGWLAAVAIALSLGHTQVHREHVAIEVISERLPGRLRQVLSVLIWLVASALFVAATWRLLAYAGELQAQGSRSETLQVRFYPWIYLVAIGCAGLALALLWDLFAALRVLWRGPERQDEGSR